MESTTYSRSKRQEEEHQPPQFVNGGKVNGRSTSNMPSYYTLKDTSDMRPNRRFRLNFNSVCVIVILAAIIYFTFSYLTFERRPEYTVERHNGKWRRGPIVDIPQKYIDDQDKIEITEGYVTIDAERNLHVHALFTIPNGKTEGLFTVLFLHGAAFSSETWRKLGSLKLMASLGLQAVAIDMPGHGKTPTESEIPDFLASVVKALKLNRPVLVAPSKAGIYAMPYVMRPEPETADDRLRGFVPIAPVGTHSYKHGDLNRVDVPTMVLLGEKDYDLGRHATADLRAMSNAEPLIILDAGHACYVEKPDVFHRFFYNFLVNIEPAILQE